MNPVAPVMKTDLPRKNSAIALVDIINLNDSEKKTPTISNDRFLHEAQDQLASKKMESTEKTITAATSRDRPWLSRHAERHRNIDEPCWRVTGDGVSPLPMEEPNALLEVDDGSHRYPWLDNTH